MEKKVAVPFVLVGALFLISTFVRWGSFRAVPDGGTHAVEFVLTGWNGAVKAFDFKTYNWMVSVAGITVLLLVAAHWFRIILLPRLISSVLLGFSLYHLIVFCSVISQIGRLSWGISLVYIAVVLLWTLCLQLPPKAEAIEGDQA